MSLKTRLNGLSKENNLIRLRDSDGNLLVEVKLLGDQSATLELEAVEGITIEKNNGWSSCH